jgi:hypothetical protein
VLKTGRLLAGAADDRDMGGRMARNRFLKFLLPIEKSYLIGN